MKTATAKDVHNEFDKASKSLLREATKIVSASNKEDNILTLKLKELGFGNSISIKDNARVIQEAQNTLSVNILYPQNNFLTEKAVKDICKKYGLLMANPKDFIGEIPVKNQMEIASFKLAQKDQFVKVLDRKKFAKNVKEIRKLQRKRNSLTEKYLNFFPFFTDIIDRIKMGQLKRECYITIPKKKFYSENNPNLSFRSEVTPEFMIVATPDNFNMENKIIVGEYKLIDEDPVVLAKVEGGFLQVSAWGDETKMDEFKTPNKN